jgi:hypothetical protein
MVLQAAPQSTPSSSVSTKGKRGRSSRPCETIPSRLAYQTFESYPKTLNFKSFRWEINIEQDEAHTTQPWDEATGNTTQKTPVVDGPNKVLRREEWKDRLLVLRNNAIAIAGIFVLQVRIESKI